MVGVEQMNEDAREEVVDKICTMIAEEIDRDAIPNVADAIEILEIVQSEIESRLSAMRSR
jgi:hypothetical protein